MSSRCRRSCFIDSSRCLVTTTLIRLEISQSLCLFVMPKHARLALLLSPYDESNVQMMIEYVLCECFHSEMDGSCNDGTFLFQAVNFTSGIEKEGHAKCRHVPTCKCSFLTSGGRCGLR